jgi:hypothetical protein
MIKFEEKIAQKQIKEEKIGRKSFYTYKCPNGSNHKATIFKGKKICQECSKSSHVYMVKTCIHCLKTMKHNKNHYEECHVFNKNK